MTYLGERWFCPRGSTGVRYTDMSAEEVTRYCERIIEVLRPYIEGGELASEVGEDETGAQALPFEAWEALAVAYPMADGLERRLPHVYAWCVVKHYAHHRDGDAWRPAVWVGCRTKEQAEALAEVCDEVYNKRGRVPSRLTNPDRYEVEFRPCDPTNLVREDWSTDDARRSWS